jgi:hypothetical protein
MLRNQFSVNVIMDPVWDINNIVQCSKTYRAVFKLLCTWKKPEVSDERLFQLIGNILSCDSLKNNIEELIECNV